MFFIIKKTCICYYWYFLNKESKLQPYFCNWFHDTLMTSLRLSNIGILKIHGVDDRYNISGTIKREAIKVMQIIDLTEKIGTL